MYNVQTRHLIKIHSTALISFEFGFLVNLVVKKQYACEYHHRRFLMFLSLLCKYLTD